MNEQLEAGFTSKGVKVWYFVIEPAARDPGYQLLLGLKEKGRPVYEPFGEIDAYNDMVQIPDDLLVLFEVSQTFTRAANMTDAQNNADAALWAGLATFAVEVQRRMLLPRTVG